MTWRADTPEGPRYGARILYPTGHEAGTGSTHPDEMAAIRKCAAVLRTEGLRCTVVRHNREDVAVDVEQGAML